jgi:hypothetical protein
MVDDLCSLGRLGAYILTAWNAKEDHLDLLALARTHPGRRAIAERLHRFYTRCAEAGLPELERLATTVERSSTPGSPTLAPKAPTGSSRPSPATPTDSATPKTNDYAPAAPPPDEHADVSTPLIAP